MMNSLEPLFLKGTGRRKGIPKDVDETHHSALGGGVETVNARYPERKQERACIFSLFPSLVVTATSIIW